MTTQRDNPSWLSWPVRADTVYTAEQEHHGMDDCYSRLEIYDASMDAWVEFKGEMRLTLFQPIEG